MGQRWINWVCPLVAIAGTTILAFVMSLQLNGRPGNHVTNDRVPLCSNGHWGDMTNNHLVITNQIHNTFSSLRDPTQDTEYMSLLKSPPAYQSVSVPPGEDVARGGYSVRFWIGMLSTARRLETLQGSKKGGRNYTFCPILMKNRGRNTTFSSFLLKYRGRNYTNFPETRKRGVEMAEHM